MQDSGQQAGGVGRVNRNQWIVIIGLIVLGLSLLAVSVLIGGGWALVLIEVVGVILAVVLFLRAQRAD
jgi:hypothetical protein